MKTLAVILHYETCEFTERLYNQLKPYEENTYDLVILDNNSKNKPKYPYISSPQNLFFGGGLNLTFQWVLDNKEYDSLLFLNSDLIVHGKNFVKALKSYLKEDYKIVSPSIIQPSLEQCYWPTMNNWYQKEIREVPWVDFQCPLIHRDIIETIKQYEDELLYGWGNDVYSGIICKENNWKIGVADIISAVHIGGGTIKKTNSKTYNAMANQGMYSFFKKIDKLDELDQMRNLARNYKL